MVRSIILHSGPAAVISDFLTQQPARRWMTVTGEPASLTCRQDGRRQEDLSWPPRNRTIWYTRVYTVIHILLDIMYLCVFFMYGVINNNNNNNIGMAIILQTDSHNISSKFIYCATAGLVSLCFLCSLPPFRHCLFGILLELVQPTINSEGSTVSKVLFRLPYLKYVISVFFHVTQLIHSCVRLCTRTSFLHVKYISTITCYCTLQNT